MSSEVSPPAMPREVRLSELLEMGVPVAWPEAVAIIGVLAVSALRQVPPISLPHIEHILVDTDGQVVAENSHPVGDNGVPALRRMLGTLLETTQPPAELMALADGSGAVERGQDLQKFANDLAFFARPDATVEIAGLAARAISYLDSLHKDAAMRALTRKAREAATAGPAPQRTQGTFTRRTPWAVLGLVVVLLGASALAWRLIGVSRPGATAASTTVGELARRVQNQVSDGVATLQEQLGLSAVDEAPPGRDRALPRTKGKRAGPTEDTARAPLPAEGAYGLADEMAVAPPAEFEPEAAAQVPGVEVPEGAPEPPVYSAQDAGVVAPAIVRPQMPAVRIGGLPRGPAGDLELLVGPDGRVEQARLVPASNRFQDRMMVSAAKTWIFEPATKDGRAVRYRLVIPITW